MNKTWKLQVTEEELRAIIEHHSHIILGDTSVERSARIHDLVKRLNKDVPEVDGDPRPKEDQGKQSDGWS